MPRKMRRAAVCSALSVKAAEERIDRAGRVWRMTEPKTREMAQALMNAWRSTASALILMAGHDETVERVGNNLPDVKLLRANYLNVRDLLNYDYLVIPQDALARDRRHPGLGRRRSRNARLRCSEAPDRDREEQRPGR